MVYNKVHLVVGVVVNIDFAMKCLNIYDEDVFLNDIYYGTPLVFKDPENNLDIMLYKYACCSEIGYENYVIGIMVKSWERTNVSCDKCEGFYACNTCLGTTDNGYYDVEMILNDVVTVPSDNVCYHCWRDNGNNIQKCIECGQVPQIKFEDTCIVKALHNFIESNSIDGEVSIICMINDCLSCT